MERARRPQWRGRGRDGGPGRGRGRGRDGKQSGWTTIEDAQRHTDEILSSCVLSAPFAKRFEDLSPHEFASRPDAGGRVGRRLRMRTNFYQMTCGAPHIYQYDVKISERGRGSRPGEEEESAEIARMPAKLNRAILSECSKKAEWPSVYAFDGQRIIYSPQPLFDSESKTATVRMVKRDEEKHFEVVLTQVARLNIEDVQLFLQQRSVKAPHNIKAALEICLKASLANDPRCISFARSFFFPDRASVQDIAEGAELRYGHIQSVRLTDCGLLLNVDVACAAFLKDQPILDYLVEITKKKSETQLRDLKERDWKNAEKALKGIEVMTTHLGDRNKKHKIVCLTPKPAESVYFKMKDGTELTVADYWKSKYGRLRFPWLPCVDASKGKRKQKLNYLPLEVCQVATDQRIRNLSSNQTRDVIRKSARKPSERLDGIRGVLRTVDFTKNANVSPFKILVDNREIEVDARALPSPHLQYSTPPAIDTENRGAWNLNGVRLYQGAILRSWAIVSFARNTDSLLESLESFVAGLKGMMEKMGLSVPRQLPPLTEADNMSVGDALKDAALNAESAFSSAPQIIMVLLPDKDPWLYKEVKHIAEGDLGLMTQCFAATSAGIGRPARGQEQYMANLILKINQKIGGTNCKIVGSLGQMFPALGQKANRPFIVFGADVTHSLTSDASIPSIGAIVASMDSHLAHFCARLVTLPPRQETLNMKDAVRELIQCYAEKNGQLPEAVFLYRDGVSDGQFESVLEHEVREFRRAFSQIDPTYDPPLTYIIVKKRHHARMFPTGNDGDRNGNPLPGTVIDSKITSKYDFDFYLNSQAGIQGTNKPAHYYVLLDENGFGSDGIQLLTYWICYLYARCTRSVSYAPPAYYAHLAAMHGRYLASTVSSTGGGSSTTSAQLHHSLQERMFFI